MSRYVRTSDLNNAIMSTKPELGVLAEEIATIFERIVQIVPTADVRENVRGEWIDDTETDDDGEIVYRGIHCSKCQYSIPYVGLKSGTNFCPSCGAIMWKGEKEYGNI